MGIQWQRPDQWQRRGRAARSFVPRVVQSGGRSTAIGASGFVAVLGVALTAGLGAGWWLAPADSGGWSEDPIEWNEVQPVPKGEITAEDADWQARAQENVLQEDGASGGAMGAAKRARFSLCHSGGGVNCVVDGDTLWIGGQNVRLADIDAPETHDPRCAAEQTLGDRATRRLHTLVNNGAVTLSGVGRDHDRYDRKLRIVAVGGASVGETLVGEGLARWYAGGRRSWCG